MDGKYARGLDAGHSLSFYKRMWLHSWFAGAALVTPENSISIFFETGDPDWTLTAHGRMATEVFKTMQTHDPGVPYTPVAIVLDHYAGYNAYQGRPWGVLENTHGDQETRDLFQRPARTAACGPVARGLAVWKERIRRIILRAAVPWACAPKKARSKNRFRRRP